MNEPDYEEAVRYYSSLPPQSGPQQCNKPGEQTVSLKNKR